MSSQFPPNNWNPFGPQNRSGVPVQPSVPGTTWFVTAGVPSPNVGNNNDLAINPNTGYIYQKQGGVWAAVGTLTVPVVSKGYTYEQPEPLMVWNINHNLGKFPSVDVLDLDGNQVLADVLQVDLNNLTVNFAFPFAGFAYLN